MDLQYKILRKRDLENSHRKIFAELLDKQGKVQGNLMTKADRCKLICIALINNNPVAIGGIKKKSNSDFTGQKADLQNFSSDFEWELGYLFTLEEYTGYGIASNIVKLLIIEYGDFNLMASTEITANPGMVRILEKNGFKHYGKPWKSNIHENYIGLFLKYI